MCKIKFCNKVKKETTDVNGLTSNMFCNKPEGHTGQCAIQNKSMDGIPDAILQKAWTTAMITMGNSNVNSPIYNRTANRWMREAMTGEQERNTNGVFKGNPSKTHIRKTEWATAQDCQDVYRDLLNEIVSIYSDNKTACPICGDDMTAEQIESDARYNKLALQGCHMEPLSEGEIRHRKGNLKFGHRHCNTIQADNTLEEMDAQLIKILKNRGYDITKG